MSSITTFYFTFKWWWVRSCKKIKKLQHDAIHRSRKKFNIASPAPKAHQGVNFKNVKLKDLFVRAVGHGRVLKGYSSNPISFELRSLKLGEILGTRKITMASSMPPLWEVYFMLRMCRLTLACTCKCIFARSRTKDMTWSFVRAGEKNFDFDCSIIGRYNCCYPICMKDLCVYQGWIY